MFYLYNPSCIEVLRHKYPYIICTTNSDSQTKHSCVCVDHDFVTHPCDEHSRGRHGLAMLPTMTVLEMSHIFNNLHLSECPPLKREIAYLRAPLRY